MFAIIKSGGKQYKVSEGDRLVVEKLIGDEGDKIELSEVLLYHDGAKVHIGEPMLANVKISATIKKQYRERKIIIFKKRRRQNSRRKNGHRQHKTELNIGKISA